MSKLTWFVGVIMLACVFGALPVAFAESGSINAQLLTRDNSGNVGVSGNVSNSNGAQAACPTKQCNPQQTQALPVAEKGHSKPVSEFKQWLKVYEAEHYQQTSLQRIDPQGDAILIRRLDQIPMKLLSTLIKGGYPQEEIQQEKNLMSAEADQKMDPKALGLKIGRTKPIDIDRLLNAIRQVIQETPDIQPFISAEHDWSPEAKRYLAYGFWHRMGRHVFGKQREFPAPLLFRSKLFLLLACGWTSRYAVTGREPALTARIMRYPPRSMQIHDLFRESYRLCGGDLYLTLLTAENVLASDPYRIDRDNDPIQQRLAYIRHDSMPIGDNYGAWYHFHGIALYGMLRAPFVARAVAEIESFGSLFLEGADKQEDYINRLGAIWGRKLSRMIKKKTWQKPLGKSDRTDYMLPFTKQTLKR